MKYLAIDKENIPYSFDIVLSNKTYSFTLKYNSYSNEITFDLNLGDKNLLRGKKIVYGTELLGEFAFDNNGNKNPDYPDEILMPYDITKDQEVVNLDNLQDKVYIYVIESD